jgi:hypothetical protein
VERGGRHRRQHAHMHSAVSRKAAPGRKDEKSPATLCINTARTKPLPPPPLARLALLNVGVCCVEGAPSNIQQPRVQHGLGGKRRVPQLGTVVTL